MTYRMFRHPEPLAKRVGWQGIGDGDDGVFAHVPHIAKLFSNPQANIPPKRQIPCRAILHAMENRTDTPFGSIAARLLWHRELMGLTQNDYAASFGIKRSAYSLWEAGSHRLSLDGALALRRKYGLPLDFMYEGIDDALPMTLRNAWRDRP